MEIFPVYCFQNGIRVNVFCAFDEGAATDFVQRETWPSQPNGFYLGSSRKVK